MTRLLTWFGHLSRGVTIAIGAAGALVLALPSFVDLASPWNFVGLVLASLLIVLAALINTAQFRAQDEQARTAEADRDAAIELAQQAKAENLVLVRDALDQFIQIFAKLPTASPSDAEGLRSAAGVHAVVAALKLADGSREGRHRSVLYLLRPEGDILEVETKEGRGVQPRAFDGTTPRGRKALGMVHENGDLYVEDLKSRSNSKWRTGDESYRSFYSTTVSAGDTNYGMLTVDSQEPGDFDESTREAIRMLGNLLGALYAIQADKRPGE